MARIYIDDQGSLCFEGFHFTSQNVGGKLYVELNGVIFNRCHVACDVVGPDEYGAMVNVPPPEDRAGAVAKEMTELLAQAKSDTTGRYRLLPTMTIPGPWSGTIEEAIDKFGPKKN